VGAVPEHATLALGGVAVLLTNFRRSQLTW
jgi:hypothetical protein